MPRFNISVSVTCPPYYLLLITIAIIEEAKAGKNERLRGNSINLLLDLDSAPLEAWVNLHPSGPF